LSAGEEARLVDRDSRFFLSNEKSCGLEGDDGRCGRRVGAKRGLIVYRVSIRMATIGIKQFDSTTN
jgi:hypothetical protein